MSDETEVEPQRMSPLRLIMRNATYIFGIFILLWLPLAKNFPEHFSPRSANESTQRRVTPQPAKTETSESKPQAATTPASVTEPQPNAQPATPPVRSEQVERLEEKLARLGDELGSLKKELEARTADHQKQSGDWSEKFEAQNRQIESLKAELQELQSHGTHQLSAITEFSILKEAASRGEPFEREFQQLQALIKDHQQLELLNRLAPFTKSGIPTLRALQAQFESLLNNAMSANTKGSGLAHSLRSLIRIRKEGEFQQGQDDEAVLARAEAKLERGDIASALKEMTTLSPPMQDAFSLWAHNAKNTVLARNAMDALQVALLRHQSPKVTEKAAPEAQAKPAAAPAASSKMQEREATTETVSQPAENERSMLDDQELESLFEATLEGDDMVAGQDAEAEVSEAEAETTDKP